MRGIRVLRQRIPAQRVRGRARRFFADCDEAFDLREIERRQLAQFRGDQHVARREQRELRAHVLLGQDVDRLLRDADERRELLARQERCADVDGDHHIRTHRPDEVDRQVVDEPAVAQDLAVDLYRREDPRHRHAGAHRDVQRSAIEDDRLAVDHAGRNGAKRDREIVEAPDGVVAPGEAVQRELEVLAGEGARRQSERKVAETEFERDRVVRIVTLATDGELASRRLIGEQ